MATRTESPLTKTLATDRPDHSMGPRIVPVSEPPSTMSGHGLNDAMDTTSPGDTSNSQGNEPDMNGKANNLRSGNSSPPDQPSNSGNMSAPSSTAAVHQPKIVQTAFIHKLYNMLEDTSIQHLISWSASAESFVMSPSPDFSKVLSQYFKHTNISSFVRQLNMYGFHKERDVFHTGNPDTTLWEFKHGNGNFKRGDLSGLREIKRRASRQHPMHREGNPYPKPSPSQPGTPAEPVPQLPPESTDARLANIEHSLYDLNARLQRSEENAHYMHVKNQACLETMARLLYFNQELSKATLSLVPVDSPTHREVLAIQGEMQRQTDLIRTLDEPQEAPFNGRQQYFSNVDNAPVSPRQLPQDDSRRANLTVPQARGQPFYRPAVPSNLSLGTRRPFGSIGTSSAAGSSPLRNAAPPPPPGPHPLSNVEIPGNLARRHTSADIREHGWQATPSPFSSSARSGPWPSSPSRVPTDDQRIRESLSTYSLQTASTTQPSSRPTTPPASNFPNGGSNSSEAFAGWSWNSAVNRDGKGLFKDSSAPPTRRGSMAHILNPSDTAERSDEDEDLRGEDDRKRKRVQ